MTILTLQDSARLLIDRLKRTVGLLRISVGDVFQSVPV
jgi:hypothetical protein